MGDNKQKIVLTNEQTLAIKYLEDKCSKFEKPSIIILTGKAGTGKSTIISELKKRHNKDWKFCSTTAKSAILFNARTIDSLFCFNRSTGLTSNINNTYRNLAIDYIKKTYNDKGIPIFTKAVIIDEASMLSKTMFDFVAKIAIQLNINLILVGDWGQIEPVNDDWFFTTDNTTIRDKLLSDIKVIKLKEIHRQKDLLFIKELDKIRLGIPDFATEELLNSRITTAIPDTTYTKLFYTREVAKSVNDEEVRNVSCKLCNPLFNLKVDIINNGFIEMTDGVKKLIKYVIDNGRFANDINFCIGCKVVLTVNSGSFVNGDTGTLVKYEDDILYVALDRADNFIVQVIKQRVNSTLDREFFDEETLMDMPREKREEFRNKKSIRFEGYPIKLGYALTVHSSQGMTIPKVYVDLSSFYSRKISGIVYVALSRVRSINDLLISCWDNSLPFIDKRVIPFL